jgi:hypothetical protein
MKTIFFLIVLFTIVGCQTPKMAVTKSVTQTQVVKDTTYISEQDALGYWLLSQPQQVRDDFKKDFTFSGEQIKEFVDTLKKH